MCMYVCMSVRLSVWAVECGMCVWGWLDTHDKAKHTHTIATDRHIIYTHRGPPTSSGKSISAAAWPSRGAGGSPCSCVVYKVMVGEFTRPYIRDDG